MTEKDKIKYYLEYKNISKNKFYQETGLSIGFLNSGNSLGADKVRTIINTYPDINLEWLIMDKGPMLRDTSEPKEPVEKQSYADDGLKNDTVTVAQLLEIVNKQVDIIKEQNREISRLRNRMSLVNSGIEIVGGGNLQNPPTPMPSQCGSAVENPSLEVQNPAQISVEKCSRK